MSRCIGLVLTLYGVALCAPGVVACSKRNSGCEEIKKVEFLFDGGSVVFKLPGINLSYRHLMVSPVRNLEPLTGEIQEAYRVKVFLVLEDEERFYGEKPLEEQSAEEKLVLDYLLDCKAKFAQCNDPWADKLQVLVKLIQDRNSVPPPVYYWQ